ncbi:maleylpyruvate isomerase N-terminal domain-containing protein [Actinotalea ferrariae]|uniref:DinB family protein n=1 Tax=Actinotalea ferrariae TaxID=1386098 RepID=UPI001C8C2684|nr:DinB family protein [Actinotalea ferrariae]MBX9243997.1 maleylpyruvate isomerase N-terminal domain-containing protein [Actinotalea ferrariae]
MTDTSRPARAPLDHAQYVDVVREEFERFLTALQGVDLASPVPSCEGWTAGDLLWHLTEVQHAWAEVVATGRPMDELPVPERPADVELLAAAPASGTALVLALAERSPEQPCWSWHDDGGTVGWVARRQAHEALIHRVDAELTAGLAVAPPTVALALDGVDELLRVMVDGVPEWGTFTPDGVRVRLACTNADAAWDLALGRFTGTGPESGKAYDLDAAAVHDVVAGSRDAGADLVVSASAWELDRWLWGRGDSSALEVTGEPALLDRLRALVTDATQ